MTAEFQALHEKAHAAGMAALVAATPTPMTVYEAELNGAPKAGGRSWYVSEGACGFAWIEFKGTTPFGRWAKKAGVARKHYPSGLCVWVGEGGQSIARKEAYARAYARTLTEAGVAAYAGSRLD